jgi:Mn-dependent DtxR family transcriptional regulator
MNKKHVANMDRKIIAEVVNTPTDLNPLQEDVGNWGVGFIRVLDHGDMKANYAVLIHEFVEKILCDFAGITTEEADAEDDKFLKGKIKANQRSYWKYHCKATKIERLFCKYMGLDWDEYEKLGEKAYLRAEQYFSKKSF